MKQDSPLIIKAATRSSPLALAQVDEIQALLKSSNLRIEFERVSFQTKGDLDKKISLTENVADDFFTDAIDQALLKGEADIAIHSAKDLPKNLHPDLKILALTQCLDETDAFVGVVHFKDLLKGAKVGTSSQIRQSQVKALNPIVEVVSIRGTIQERLELIKEGICDGIIVATAALKRLGLSGLIKDIMPWEGAPLQGQLAVVGRIKDNRFDEIFKTIDARQGYGKVILVGAGPGDPELITLKGKRALEEADVVFYDYLVHTDCLKFAPNAQKIYVGKRKGGHTLAQDELSRMLRVKAMEGKTVVRLKGGDPLIFGRGADEILYLSSYHVHVDVVPGVSSATAIPSTLGIPLTARDVASSVAFISGHGKDEDENSPQPIRIPAVDTIVFFMGLTKLDAILKSLNDAQWKSSTPVIVISKGTRSDERVVAGTLENIKSKTDEARLEPPALIIVGDVVKFWKDKGKHQSKVLYTGTNPKYYEALGEIVHFPMIEIIARPLPDYASNAFKVSALNCEYVLLTSRHAVKYFWEVYERQNCPLNVLQKKKFLVVGRETALALRAKGCEPTLMPEEESGEGLFEAIRQAVDVRGKVILFPRSSLPNPYLEQQLTQLGAQVDTYVVYQNVKPAKRELPTRGISNVVFTSPSTVVNFLKDYGQIPNDWRIISRGPLTSKTLEEAGYKSEVFVHG